MIIFPGGERLKWNFRRGGGSILGADFGKSRGGGGVIRKIPSVGGYGYFLELHINITPLITSLCQIEISVIN